MNPVLAFTYVPVWTNKALFHRHVYNASPTPLQMQSVNNDNTNPAIKGNKKIIQRPVNEFSRSVSTDKLISTRREYSMQVTATEEELTLLAKRFSLPNITNLHANITLSRAIDRQDHTFTIGRGSSAAAGVGDSCIQIQGTVQSTCVQTCVRTNDNFFVDKQFTLFALVRPCSFSNPISSMTSSTTTSASMVTTGVSLSNSNTPTKQKNKYKQQQARMNRQQIKLVQNFMNHPTEQLPSNKMMMMMHDDDDIIEDEAILGQDGMLDVGELVAQMFRVKLDPYPKKPGTTPVTYTITG